MTGTRRARFDSAGLGRSPEFAVTVFGFLLNYPWEFLQVPFYRGMATASHWEAVVFCSSAAVGDAGIALAAYWVVSAWDRSRAWVLAPGSGQVLGFTGATLAITVVLEWLNTDVLGRWEYGAAMPTVPPLGTGLLPLLQWVVLGPLIVWFTRRHLLGATLVGAGAQRGGAPGEDPPRADG
jgi:hypothetical protein